MENILEQFDKNSDGNTSAGEIWNAVSQSITDHPLEAAAAGAVVIGAVVLPFVGAGRVVTGITEKFFAKELSGAANPAILAGLKGAAAAERSAWNPAVGSATEALINRGVPVTAATRDAMINPAVSSLPAGLRGEALQKLLGNTARASESLPNPLIIPD